MPPKPLFILPVDQWFGVSLMVRYVLVCHMSGQHYSWGMTFRALVTKDGQMALFRTGLCLFKKPSFD